MITDYTAKDAPAVFTLEVNSNNSQYQGNPKSTDINYDETVEAGNETEIICTWVTLLFKFLASNNSHNSMWKLPQDILVQIQQIDMYVAFLPW